MNHLALLSMLADSLHMWIPILVFNSFSLKMSLMRFVHDTIVISSGNQEGLVTLLEKQDGHRWTIIVSIFGHFVGQRWKSVKIQRPHLAMPYN